MFYHVYKNIKISFSFNPKFKNSLFFHLFSNLSGYILVIGGTLAVVGYQFTCPHQTRTNNRTLKDALQTVYSETKDYWSSERYLH